MSARVHVSLDAMADQTNRPTRRTLKLRDWISTEPGAWVIVLMPALTAFIVRRFTDLLIQPSRAFHHRELVRSACIERDGDSRDLPWFAFESAVSRDVAGARCGDCVRLCLGVVRQCALCENDDSRTWQFAVSRRFVGLECVSSLISFSLITYAAMTLPM